MIKVCVEGFFLFKITGFKYDNEPFNYSILTFPVLVDRMADLNVPAKNSAGSVG